MQLDFNNKDFDIKINLPASKSIHNRVLILDALFNLNLEIINPSNSADSLLLQSLLKSKSKTLNCENAGTVFRFLTAFYAVGDKSKVLTGSERMLKRPVGDLVKALRSLGVREGFLLKEAFPESFPESEIFPPIKISGGLKKGGSVTINGQTSSQFISAIAMIGPKLEGGLQIIIEGKISSKPYIEMTIKLMQNFGFDIEFTENIIIAKQWNGVSKIKTIEIEPDWSAVAFWFQLISLSNKGKVLLEKLKIRSIQGDSVLAQWAEMLGIKLTEKPEGILLEKSSIPIPNNTEWDFTNYPDLAPSIIVLISALKLRARFKGLDSLKIKESDRTLALQTELKKCKVVFEEKNNEWILDASNFELIENTTFENYNDHRIAMALACLAIIKPIEMNNPETVNKSYPDFWKHTAILRT